MKQLITPIAIIVALIAFFVIIDRKEFSRHDDLQTVQSESTTSNRKATFFVPETKPITEVKPAVEAKPVVETKPIAENKPVAEAKPKTDSKPAGTKPVVETKPAEEKPVETKPVAEAKPVTEAKHITEAKPAAVPVLSPEEALLLVQKQEKEREEAKKRGFVFYEERFLSMRNVSSNPGIQQTVNWNYVAKDNDSATNGIAKKQDYFSIKSESPIEYLFSEPLYEYTIYQYSLCCSVKGNGIVILSQKDGKDPKKYFIDSNIFESFVYTLGNGESFNTKIVPSISFQGDIQVESVTLQQKEINHERTICLGRIESISNVPDIKKSDYPDCYYTAKLVVKDILDGNPAPQNIQLLIPAFLNNKIDPLSTIMKKGNWKIAIRPFSLATEKEQEIEQVDEIESFLFTPYILVAASPSSFSTLESGIPILEGESYISPFDNPVNPPLPVQFAEDSKREIEAELTKVNSIIELVKDENAINAEFQLAWDEKQKQYDSLNSSLVWAKEQNSYFALPKKWTLIPSARITEENIEALEELNLFFQSQGIQFIIQIVPHYYDIAALVLNPGYRKYGDQRSARVARQLLEHGIEAQYLSDELVKKALEYERLYCYPTNFHPDEGTYDVITSIMAKRLERFGSVLPKTMNSNSFSIERHNICGNSVRWPQGVDIGNNHAGEIVQTPYIYYDGKRISSDPQSKILVIGNSFVNYPMDTLGYLAYLSSKIYYKQSAVSMGGIGALVGLPQLLLRNPDQYLHGKLVCILPISVTILSSNQYHYTNLRKMDSELTNLNSLALKTIIPVKDINHSLFPSHFNFTTSYLMDFLSNHTSTCVLSNSRDTISFKIPDNCSISNIRITLQPLSEQNITLLVNNTPFKLPSTLAPLWNVIDYIPQKDSSEIYLKIDKDNSDLNPFVLISNISLFESK